MSVSERCCCLSLGTSRKNDLLSPLTDPKDNNFLSSFLYCDCGGDHDSKDLVQKAKFLQETKEIHNLNDLQYSKIFCRQSKRNKWNNEPYFLESWQQGLKASKLLNNYHICNCIVERMKVLSSKSKDFIVLVMNLMHGI